MRIEVGDRIRWFSWDSRFSVIVVSRDGNNLVCKEIDGSIKTYNLADKIGSYGWIIGRNR